MQLQVVLGTSEAKGYMYKDRILKVPTYVSNLAARCLRLSAIDLPTLYAGGLKRLAVARYCGSRAMRKRYQWHSIRHFLLSGTFMYYGG
jgi:hypothetical protein